MDVKDPRHYGNGMSHLEDVDGYARFTVHMEGRRAMDVLVNCNAEVATPEGSNLNPGWSLHPILIAQVDAPAETAKPTKGYAAATWELEDDGFTRKVQLSSINSYVAPRLAYLIARLFVPPYVPPTA